MIDIDPIDETGEPVWITYGREVIGTINVLGGGNDVTDNEEKTSSLVPGHVSAKTIGNSITGGAVKETIGQASFALGLLVAFLVVSAAGNLYWFTRKRKK